MLTIELEHGIPHRKQEHKERVPMKRNPTEQIKKQPAKAVLADSSKAKIASVLTADHVIWRGDSEAFLKALPLEPIFDLVVTSPPIQHRQGIRKEGRAR